MTATYTTLYNWKTKEYQWQVIIEPPLAWVFKPKKGKKDI